MRGSNTLKLNEATLIEAMQEYLDRRTVGTKQVVESVTQYGTSDVFDVKINEGDEGNDGEETS